MNQHEGLDFKHPQGGQAKYLEQPLYDGHRDYLGDVARQVLTGSIIGGMATAMESLSSAAFQAAPREFHDLRASGNPRVYDNGALVYDRPPAVPRLTEEQLRAKGQLRKIGPGGFGDVGGLYGY